MTNTSIWTQPVGGTPFTDAERRQVAVISAGVWRGLAKWSLLAAAAWLLMHLAACQSATAPAAPRSILFTNAHSVGMNVSADDSTSNVSLPPFGTLGQLHIAGRDSLCVRFDVSDLSGDRAVRMAARSDTSTTIVVISFSAALGAGWRWDGEAATPLPTVLC